MDCNMPKVTIPGVGPDAPLMRDAQQSFNPYAFDLLPKFALFAVAGRMRYGQLKGYENDGWKSIQVQEHISHALTHFYSFLAGDRSDDHLTGAAVRTLMALDLVVGPGLSSGTIQADGQIPGFPPDPTTVAGMLDQATRPVEDKEIGGLEDCSRSAAAFGPHGCYSDRCED